MEVVPPHLQPEGALVHRRHGVESDPVADQPAERGVDSTSSHLAQSEMYG